MEDDGFVEFEDIYDEYEVVMDEEFMKENEFESNESLPWDWEDRLYEERRDRQMIKERKEE